MQGYNAGYLTSKKGKNVKHGIEKLLNIHCGDENNM
jgi:hypothetical protein